MEGPLSNTARDLNLCIYPPCLLLGKLGLLHACSLVFCLAQESDDALKAYGALAFVLGLGALQTPLLRSDNASDLFYFVALVGWRP